MLIYNACHKYFHAALSSQCTAWSRHQIQIETSGQGTDRSIELICMMGKAGCQL